MDVNDRRARATEEATHWWTRFGTKAPAEVSEADRQEFTQWLRESPLHVAELLHVAHVHDALERFGLWSEVPLGTQHADDTITALPSARGRTEQAGSGGRINGNHRRVKFFLAASTAVLAVAAGWLAVRSSATTLGTERAERREVMLPDGSIVNLEPETTLRVSFGERRRYVVLTRGRALFHVAKDSARPFIVHAGNADVRAVGTTFGIEQRNQRVVVTVSEGRVAVVPAAQRQAVDPSLKLLAADQQITVQASGAASPIEKVDSSRALAWSEGRLVFDSAPLTEVAEEFNRYNRVQLRVRGDELRRRTISGVFKASDPQTLVDFIGAGAHVTIARHGSDEIVISPGP